ncbi:hypothetical protein, partial [Chryseobacterium sp. 18068]|uniref:hypothetical protein n=1 Tax=Chryseobacterium sp. 18068 TaxID=2681414 RepID=UPI001E2D9ABE
HIGLRKPPKNIKKYIKNKKIRVRVRAREKKQKKLSNFFLGRWALSVFRATHSDSPRTPFSQIIAP